MFRVFVCSLFAVILFTVTLFANEYKGKANALSPSKKFLGMFVDGEKQRVKYDDKTQFIVKGKAIEHDKLEDLADTIEKSNAEVIVNVDDTTGVAKKITFVEEKK